MPAAAGGYLLLDPHLDVFEYVNEDGTPYFTDDPDVRGLRPDHAHPPARCSTWESNNRCGKACRPIRLSRACLGRFRFERL
jgi:hypothetical protein